MRPGIKIGMVRFDVSPDKRENECDPSYITVLCGSVNLIAKVPERISILPLFLKTKDKEFAPALKDCGSLNVITIWLRGSSKEVVAELRNLDSCQISDRAIYDPGLLLATKWYCMSVVVLALDTRFIVLLSSNCSVLSGPKIVVFIE